MRTLASICFSSSVGRWVDASPNRLKTLMKTISVNRGTVIAACVVWFFIVPVDSDTPGVGMSEHGLPVTKHLLFIVILLLGIGENLSASGNMISVCKIPIKVILFALP